MPPKRKFTDEQVLEAHSRGLTLRETAEALGAHYSTIWEHAAVSLNLKFKRASHPRRGADDKPQRTKAILEQIAAGVSCNVIARQYGISGSRVAFIAKREKERQS